MCDASIRFPNGTPISRVTIIIIIIIIVIIIIIIIIIIILIITGVGFVIVATAIICFWYCFRSCVCLLLSFAFNNSFTLYSVGFIGWEYLARPSFSVHHDVISFPFSIYTVMEFLSLPGIYQFWKTEISCSPFIVESSLHTFNR